MRVGFLFFAIGILCFLPAIAQQDTVYYKAKYFDPVIEEMRNQADSLAEIQDSITDDITERYDELEKYQKEHRRSLLFDVSHIKRPASPDEFSQVFHFPPEPQYLTGTCWCFSTTSLLESEVYRLTGRKIKLSEMYTVYFEYIEKVRYFVRERGMSNFGQGSESNAVLRMIKKYGAVPYNEYTGLTGGNTRHDHSRVSRELRALLAMVKENNLWDEAVVVEQARAILDKYLGEPPDMFDFDGRSVTPREFAAEILKINPDDYISVMSTLSIPFYTQGPFEVYDNWWNDSSYYNIPLDEWYAVMKKALNAGYSFEVGGDNSEPGWYGFEDIAVVPSFDIPQKNINQDSREFRFYNGTTGDDHGLHVVGLKWFDGRDWFLVKDSGRSGRWGKFKGYFFFRDDYMRLKMLTLIVHRDVLDDIVQRFE